MPALRQLVWAAAVHTAMAFVEHEMSNRAEDLPTGKEASGSNVDYPRAAQPENPLRKSLRRLGEMLSPAYHIRQMKEDMGAFKLAMANRQRLLHEGDHSDLEELFRGRLLGTFYLSGPSNLVGIGLTSWLQVASGNPYFALFMPVICYLTTAVAYQAVWLHENRKLYGWLPGNLGTRFMAMERDLWPVHKASFRYALFFYFLLSVTQPIVIWLVDSFSHQVAQKVPFPVIMTLVEFLMISAPFVRNMSDFFEQYAPVIAERYRVICLEHQAKHEPV